MLQRLHRAVNREVYALGNRGSARVHRAIFLILHGLLWNRAALSLENLAQRRPLQ